MKKSLALTAVAGWLLASFVYAAEGPPAIELWPGDVPGEKGDVGEEKVLEPREGQKPVMRITNVTRPSITLYRPDKDKDTGAAVLICPGGGYHILAWDLEGTEVAEWLNANGVTGIVMKYRVPRRKDRPKHLAPLQDAQRATSMIRSNAEKWGIDPNRIGILGFSAGGHLAASASTNFDQRQYDPIDAVDEVSCRPDFTVLLYPAYLVEEDALAPEIRVSAETPPTFFVHAGDDRISPENSVRMFLALKQAGVPAELHVFKGGGHGFGLRPSDDPCSGWPRLCEQWMKAQGILTNE